MAPREVLAGQPQFASVAAERPRGRMSPISFKRHRFSPAVVCQAVRWYFRFTLSIRDVEELKAEREVEVNREPIRNPPGIDRHG